MGVTETSAKKIADVLRSKYQLEVDLVDLKEENITQALRSTEMWSSAVA